MRRRTRLLALLALSAAAGCGGCKHGAPRSEPGTGANQAGGERRLVLFATAEIRGTPEPCGCQSDPLGDVARVGKLVTEARSAMQGEKRGGVLLVDAGGLRYGAEKIRPEQRGQAELKAQFLEKAWQDLGALVALGDEDLMAGPAGVPAGRRLCSNLTGLPAASPAVRDVGGIRVGVFALIDRVKEEAWHAAGLEATDEVEAARAQVKALRDGGAEVVVALAHVTRAAARKLARDVPGLSIVVAGDELGDDGAEAEQVGETIVVQPAQQAQKVAKVELIVVDGAVSTKLFAGVEVRQRELARIEKKLDGVARSLTQLKADPAADPSYIQTKEAEARRLRGERDALKSSTVTAPRGSYATAELIPIRRKIARDAAMEAAMKDLDARVGEANRSAAEKIPPPPAPEGEARYVGNEECEDCHSKATKQWAGTVHAKAWEELVKVNKQWSYDCISCHVTGYGRVGGSAMAHVKGLEDVGCEVCHGPGSLHVDDPKVVHLPNPVEADCKECHTKEHSDTFQYIPYLRDVIGAGHGEKRRAALGPGETGHDLRHGAIERAKEKAM